MDPLRPDREVCGNDFRLWGAVAERTLLLAHPAERTASIRTHYCEPYTGSAPQSIRTAGEVGISEEVGTKVAHLIATVRHHPKMECRMNVAHKPIQLPVTLIVPLGDFRRKAPHTS